MGSRSGSRNGYRLSGKASYVDESLFGNNKPSGSPGARSQVEVLDKTTSRSPGGSFRSQDVSLVKRTDLERMLKSSPVLTAEDIAAAKREADAKREQLQAVSKARKEKMLKLEEEARKHAPETETDRLRREANLQTLSRADQLLLEEKDKVKQMNQMMLYSKCVTIRDAQIEEKRQMMMENEEENRKQDLMMEVERLRALEQYEAREKQRQEERKRGARVLKDQLAEREAERVRQEELRDQERIVMLKEIERMKEEELQQQIEKRLQAKALVEEVAAANQEQIRRKEAMKVRERDEDAKIATYIRQKEMKEAEIAAEKERIAREKELEVARLRAQQERAADKQSELDELRARRYQEAKEREWRGKERAAAEKATALQRELAEARLAQQHATLKQRAEMARVEHDEFMRVLAVNRAKEQEDMQQTATQLRMNWKYKEELLGQIGANEEKRKKERQEYLEEGERIRMEAEKERQLLAAIKERKLRELEDSGVPSKYRAELEKLKIKT